MFNFWGTKPTIAKIIILAIKIENDYFEYFFPENKKTNLSIDFFN